MSFLDSVQDAALSTTNTLLDGALEALIGLSAGLLLVLIAVVLTWTIAHFVFRPADAEAIKATPQGGAPPGAFRYDGLLLVRAENLLTATGLSAFTEIRGFGQLLGELWQGLRDNILTIGGLLLIAAAALILINNSVAIWGATGELVQCQIQPALNTYILPLLNAARLLYSSFYPTVNAGAEVLFALTWGNFRVVLACVDTSVLQEFFTTLGSAVAELLLAIVDWVANGLFFHGRIELMYALELAGNATLTLRPIADCYCGALAPVWDLVFGIFPLTSLHQTIDCGVNVGTRTVQLVLVNSFVRFELPEMSEWTEEVQCTVLSAGDTVEAIVRLIVHFFLGLFELVEEYVFSLSTAQRAPLYVQAGLAHAQAASTLTIPPVLAELRASPALPMRGLSLAWYAASRDLMYSSGALPASAAYVTTASTLNPYGTGSDAPFTFWTFLRTLNLAIMFGFDTLLRLASVPWTHLVTEWLALGAAITNVTVNAVFHPTQAFDDPSGIRYFQLGFMGDRLRTVGDTAAQLLVVIDPVLPCSVSRILQTLFSIPEVGGELFFSAVYTTIFPPWRLGNPPPVNCSLVTCGHPAPVNWSFFDVFPEYYAWNESRLRRMLTLLLEGGECTAFALGCNTTADNNNSTNLTSDCGHTPLACMARSINKLLVEGVNVTLTFILYLPDLVRFDASRHTWRDIPFETTEAALRELASCFSRWLDTLDENGDMCLTPDAPGSRPRPENGSLPATSPTDGLFGIPPRTEWECRLNGEAYYYDGRVVVIRNTTDSLRALDMHLECDPTSSRECGIAVSDGGHVQIIGSAPEDNVTVLLSPYPDADVPMVLWALNATTGDLLQALPNASTLLNDYDITQATFSDCTSSLPLPTPLPDTFMCFNDLFTTDLNTYYRDVYDEGNVNILTSAGERINDTVVVPCDYTLAPDYICPAGFLQYRSAAQPVYIRNTQVVPAVDIPLGCFIDGMTQRVYVPALGCQLNRALVPLGGVSGFPINAPVNETSALLVFYYEDLATTDNRIPVACELATPAGYECSPQDDMAVDGVSVQAYNPAPFNVFVPFPCRHNPLSVAPVCTRLTLNYTDGSSVVADVEGGEVRVWVNGTLTPVPCLYGDAPEGASASVSSVTVSTTAQQPLLLTTQTLQAYMAAARQQVLKEAVRPSSSGASKLAGDPLYLAWLAQAPSPTKAAFAAATSGAYLNRLISIADLNTSSAYRKETFLCCLSTAIEEVQVFVIAFVYEWIYTGRAILDLPAHPSQSFPVPTFAEARDNLRAALCDLACAVTRIFPAAFACPGLGAAGCTSGASCARNFLCDLLDIPILLVDMVVETLQMVKQLAVGQSPNNTILGPTCSRDDPGSCVVSFLLYVVTKTLYTATLVLRGFAAFLDCVLCALIRVADPSYTCTTIIYRFVDALADLIDGLGTILLTAIINFWVGVVEAFVYFFSGQFDKFFSAVWNKIFGSIGIFFVRIGEFIWQSFLRLPGVGTFFNIILGFIRDSCSVVNKVLTLFGASDIGCAGIGTKRALSVVIVWPNVSDVWQVGGAAASACGARMALLNSSDYTNLTTDQQHELYYCMLAHLWVGPVATNASDQGMPHPCDVFMPQLYTAGYEWPSLDPTAQARALECIQPRFQMEEVRAADGYANTWAPHDLLYSGNPLKLLPLMDDLVMAYDVWSQYAADRAAPAGTVVSSAYRAEWAADNFSVAHLDQLASTATVAGDVYSALDAAEGAFSIEAYAARAVAQPPRGVRALLGRRYNADRIAAMAARLWQPTLNGSADGQTPSMMGFVVTKSMDHLEARIGSASLSVALTTDLPWRLVSANDSRVLQHTVSGMVDAVTLDIPAMLVRLIRASNVSSAGDAADGLKRAVVSSLGLPGLIWRALVGAVYVSVDFLGARTTRAELWLRQPAVLAWLSAHAGSGYTGNVVTAGLVNASTASGGSPVREAMVSMLGSLASTLPSFQPLRDLRPLFERALSESVPTGATLRRASVSRLVSLFGLGVAEGMGLRVQVAPTRVVGTSGSPMVQTTEVNNETGLPCLLFIEPRPNSTINSSYPFCQTCPGADRLLGTIGQAFYKMARYYGFTGGYCANHTELPECVTILDPSFNLSRQRYQELRTYLSDATRPAILGDSDELPARFPWRDYDNWRILGDPSPNKLGFRDIAGLWAATWDYFKSALNGTSAGKGLLDLFGISSVLNQTRATVNTRLGPSQATRDVNINARFGQFLATAVDGAVHYWSSFSSNHSNNSSKSSSNAASFAFGTNSSSSLAPQGPFASLDEVLFAWGDFLYRWWIRCDYYEELNGTGKRFSIGEVWFGAILAALISAVILERLLPGQWLTILGGSGVVFGLVYVVGTLVVAYSWAFLCAPALPQGLGDDSMHFVAYTVAPVCPIVLGGLVNEATYNNSNCRACEAWAARAWTFPDIPRAFDDGGLYGFSDIRYNVAFALRAYFPDALYWLQTTGLSTPILGYILSFDFVRIPLFAYDFYDPAAATVVAFSQFNMGNAVFTVLNAAVVGGVLALAIFLWPLIARVLSTFLVLAYLVLLVIFFGFFGWFILGDFAVRYDPYMDTRRRRSQPPPSSTEVEMRDTGTWI